MSPQLSLSSGLCISPSMELLALLNSSQSGQLMTFIQYSDQKIGKLMRVTRVIYILRFNLSLFSVKLGRLFGWLVHKLVERIVCEMVVDRRLTSELAF